MSTRAQPFALILHRGRLCFNALLKGKPNVPMNAETSPPSRKAQIDAVLLKLPGVSGKKIGGLDAYFVSDRMFACISGNGVGLRLPVAVATELQFSRANVVPFYPGGVASTREWIQIDRADAADYEQDIELFQASAAFVKSSRTR
jgi:hypothetical protein